MTYFAVDNAGNQEREKTLTVQVDKTPPTVACVPVPQPKLHDDDESQGRLLFRVTASDLLSQVTIITLGAFQLVDGEIIQIQATNKPGVQLFGETDDDDLDGPRIKRFRVGLGANVIKATDVAGNLGTAVCPLPSKDDDDRKEDDRGKGRERARSDS